MSGKIEISRELLEEVVAQLDDFITGNVLERLKSALAAQVVEHQEPVGEHNFRIDRRAKESVEFVISRGMSHDGGEDLVLQSNGWVKLKLIGNDQCRVVVEKAPPAPVSVVLPERGGISNRPNFNEGWNACLDKFKELNG